MPKTTIQLPATLLATFPPSRNPLACIHAIAAYTSAGAYAYYQLRIRDGGAELASSDIITDGSADIRVAVELQYTFDFLRVPAGSVFVDLYGIAEYSLPEQSARVARGRQFN